MHPQESREMIDLVLDGNAAAGPLREIFATDVTAARGTCTSCGNHGMVAELRVYARGPGVVARCHACENVLLRLVRAGDRAWLDVRGLSSLELHL